MSPRRRKFERPLGERRYRKLFVIAVEGENTEPQYFAIFKDWKLIIQIKCLKSKGKVSAQQILARMKNYLKQEGLKDSDEAWLVVDKDSNSDERLEELFKWSCGKNNHGLALSNPKFEYWLLLHFEDGNNIATSAECSKRLKMYLPNYDKSIDTGKFTPDTISEAIRRARNRDNPPCSKWPCGVGTTVYKLVENICNEPQE
jgi:hypothetical protein